jgi:hypothetical protein
MIWIGYDPREAEAFAACRLSVRQHLNQPIPVRGLVLSDLKAKGLYTRETITKDNGLWDVISEAPMATEFAISRFLVPALSKTGWAVFMDCDMLAMANIGSLFRLDPSKAVYCVKHKYEPKNTTKMDGQLQTFYRRKNWSSFMVFNCDHPSNAVLTPEFVNSLPGRDLHRFCWLKDKEIGSLDPAWNFLVGHSDPSIKPKVIHWTNGGPWFKEYENEPFADEWRKQRDRWAA